MKKLACILATATITVSCTGVVYGPEDTVAKLTFVADMQRLGALVSKECIALHGDASKCTGYPNAFECDNLEIAVKADGRTLLSCRYQGRLIHQGLANGLLDGAPIECTANKDLSCQVCYDTRGAAVLDTCNDRGAQLFRVAGRGWGDAPDTIPGVGVPENPGTTPRNPGTTPKNPTPTPPNPTVPPTPPTPGTPGSLSRCDPRRAILHFANALNNQFNREGLRFSWAPDINAFPNPNGGFWKNKHYARASSLPSKYKRWAFGNKNCTKGGVYGLSGLFGKLLGQTSGTVCRGYRVGYRAFADAEPTTPAGCDKGKWQVGYSMAYGTSVQWLFSGAPGRQPPQITVPPGSPPPAIGKPPKVLGSPLVLDLAGDGVAPTSVFQGVRFDLVGGGKLKTAWIQGDDALLVLDRDGNGMIDSGRELFGEAAMVDGFNAETGFDALAVLDRPSEGGNGNGLIEAGDLMFSELRVWQDRNSDGISQPDELRTLKEAGISALSLSHRSASQFDAFGNDLGLAGSFARTDGTTGQMIDVLFLTKK